MKKESFYEKFETIIDPLIFMSILFGAAFGFTLIITVVSTIAGG